MAHRRQHNWFLGRKLLAAHPNSCLVRSTASVSPGVLKTTSAQTKAEDLPLRQTVITLVAPVAGLAFCGTALAHCQGAGQHKPSTSEIVQIRQAARLARERLALLPPGQQSQPE